MKKILVIDGHPNKDSLCYSLAQAYADGAKSAGAEVKTLRIIDLHFDPILRYGYQKRMDLEPDLLAALELLHWADHMVWVHPVWWSGLPALVKGFLDRLFLPGLTYKTIPNSYRFEKLLKGKTAHIIATLDQPGWFYRLFFKAPSEHQLRSSLYFVIFLYFHPFSLFCKINNISSVCDILTLFIFLNLETITMFVCKLCANIF